MAGTKTRQTDASVDAYLDAIGDPARRADCHALVELMSDASGFEPRMWGSAIVGFGSYHYKYESGREGDSCLVGFASRKSDLVLYLMSGFAERDALLARLGKHRTGTACHYLKRLADVDHDALAELVRSSVWHMQQRQGPT
jgi:hypothetical protein